MWYNTKVWASIFVEYIWRNIPIQLHKIDIRAVSMSCFHEKWRGNKPHLFFVIVFNELRWE